MNLKILPQDFSVCKVSDFSQINWDDPFIFLSKTDEELSLVCSTNSVPKNCTHQENEWRAFRIERLGSYFENSTTSRIRTRLKN